MFRLALFGVLTLGLTAAAQEKKDVSKDLQPFQGTWKVVKVESEGKTPPKDPSGVRFKFAGDKLTVVEGARKKEETGTVTVDAAKDPAEFNFEGPRNEKIMGIYKFEKDGKLHLCIATGKGSARPKSFDTSAGRSRLLVLEKVKE